MTLCLNLTIIHISGTFLPVFILTKTCREKFRLQKMARIHIKFLIPSSNLVMRLYEKCVRHPLMVSNCALHVADSTGIQYCYECCQKNIRLPNCRCRMYNHLLWLNNVHLECCLVSKKSIIKIQIKTWYLDNVVNSMPMHACQQG